MNHFLNHELIDQYPVYFFNMDNYLDTTGKRIRYLRDTVNGWKGTEFLERLKRETGEVVQSSTLTNHEKGTAMPGYETLVNYAKTLGTTTDFLLMVTEDMLPTKKIDRNVIIEARGEEERRILEEISSLLEETDTGDLRLILDIVRRILPSNQRSSRPTNEGEIESLIRLILVTIEQVGGKSMRKKALADMEASLPPSSPFAAVWRRFRA